MTQYEGYKQYFDTLELKSGAPYSEVRAAYVRLKNLYGGDSIVLAPLDDELPDEWKQSVLERIEEAYEKLSEYYRQGGGRVAPTDRTGDTASPRVDESTRQRLDAVEHFSGDGLKQVRELLNLEVHEVSLSTKISKQHIKNIEEENFSALPEEVFLRGYLASCAKLYSVDPGRVVSEYMERYRAWKSG